MGNLDTKEKYRGVAVQSRRIFKGLIKPFFFDY